MFGWLVGIFISVLTLIGYTLYRFASWIYYSELEIDEKSGKMTRLKKVFDRIQKTELIIEKFEPTQFEYSELTRSGKTKYLMKYRTHKNHELLILKNKSDKELIEKYIAEKITVYNNVYSAYHPAGCYDTIHGTLPASTKKLWIKEIIIKNVTYKFTRQEIETGKVDKR
jgi:hypothetical protein